MTKKSICLTFFVLLLVSVGNVDAVAFRYTDAGADHLWSNPYNWEATVPSDYGSHDAQMQLDGTICEITTGIQATCRGCYIGCYGHTNEMYITGGSLECRWLNVGRGRDPNTNGYFEMTGGVVNAQNLDIPNAFNNNPDYMAVGTAKVHGGTINLSSNIHIGDRVYSAHHGGYGTLDMAGDGKIILAGDKTSQVSEYLYNGYITASDPGGMLSRPVTPVLSYDEGLDKTTLAAATTTTEQAYNPSPHNWAKEVYTIASHSTTLSWDAGAGAVTHDLYLSTDPSLVAASDPTVKTASATSPYAAGNLELGQTYYWQIAETDGLSQTHTGQMWSFQVPEYLLVDDFEGYSDTSNLHGTWTNSESIMSSLANWGMNNTPYGNRLSVSMGAGRAGQVSCVPAGSDWTAKNVKGLYVNVYGSNANDANAKLSVTLNDMATITYAGSLLDENWTTWKIPLADFGLDLSGVTKLAFVFDNANGVMALAVDIDDIRLVPEECIAPPAADLNDDCKVDFSDLHVLIDDWLTSGLSVP